MYHIREALEEDASAIAPHLREADKKEITAISGVNHTQALLYSILSSDSYTACLPDCTPIAVFGVGDGEPEEFGIPWMVGTDQMLRYRKPLIKDARKWVDSYRGRYRVLCNYVDARNRIHIRWLQHIGFTISTNPEYVGVDKSVPFLSFYRSMSCA